MRTPSSVDAREDAETTRERLRVLIRRIESRPTPVPRPIVRMPRPRSLAELFPEAAPRVTAQGECLVREVRYEPDHTVGAFEVGTLAHLGGSTLELLAPAEALTDARLHDLLFLDVEATGLGGAGVIAFLVATAQWRDGALVLRQYLARSPAEEGAVLEAVVQDSDLREADPVLVTYNGRAFDAPLLDSRAIMHRRRAGFEGLRHLDMLVPAREGFRGVLPGCRLADLEHAVLGLTRPAGEVPGGEVPAWYFRWLRTADARCLDPIIRHNEVDVVALAVLTARLGALLHGAEPRSPQEMLATGRLLARRGRDEAAARRLEVAATSLPSEPLRAEAWMRLAALRRRAGDRGLAAHAWHEAAELDGGRAIEALVELAKHHEHVQRDFAAALEAIERALVRVRTLARLDGRAADRWERALHYRRARVDSKLTRSRASRS